MTLRVNLPTITWVYWQNPVGDKIIIRSGMRASWTFPPSKNQSTLATSSTRRNQQAIYPWMGKKIKLISLLQSSIPEATSTSSTISMKVSECVFVLHPKQLLTNQSCLLPFKFIYRWQNCYRYDLWLKEQLSKLGSKASSANWGLNLDIREKGLNVVRGLDRETNPRSDDDVWQPSRA